MPENTNTNTTGKHRKTCSQMVLNFTPSWFSVNMGTGIISLLLFAAPHQFHAMYYFSVVFYVLNCVLFTLFFLITLTRYIVFPWIFWRMLQHPAQSMFLGTFPMGLATIINATVLITVPAYGQWAITMVHVLWWIDVALSVLTCFGIPFLMFNVHHLSIEKMTAGWLLPIVPTVVAAASGGYVATVLNPDDAFVVLITSYCLWGLGLGLSFMVIALYFQRLALHHLPEAEVIVSAFLPLGPLGQGSFGIIQISQAGKKVFLENDLVRQAISSEVVFIVSVIVGLLLWGLGLWWFFHGITSVLVRCIRGKIPFNMGFWGFIFPFGVFTSSTVAISKALPSAFFSYLAMVFIVALVILWLYVAAGTLKKAFDQSLFVAPCLSCMTDLSNGVNPGSNNRVIQTD